MSKRARQNLIQSILRQSQVASQEELRQALAGRGVEVTQATLSRDLRELGVVKGAGGYLLPEAAGNGHRNGAGAGGAGGGGRSALERAVREYLVSAVSAGNLVVVHTGPGRAQPVALELDLAPPPEVLGTVAGDDTIFIATVTAGAGERLAGWLREVAGLGEQPRTSGAGSTDLALGEEDGAGRSVTGEHRALPVARSVAQGAARSVARVQVGRSD